MASYKSKYLNTRIKYPLTVLFFLLLSALFSCAAQNFKDGQKKYERVRSAYTEKEQKVKTLLASKHIKPPYKLFMRAFKQEAVFELWAKGSGQSCFALLKSYEICAPSGELGPKRKEGDLQVPEGFYHINHFNPYSNFWLSLGINYPNASDRKLSDLKKPGGHIYIHGNCVTLGCIPLTDEVIKEVYVMCVEARNNGQTQIPVHIFPFRMEAANCKTMYARSEYKSKASLIAFWKNIAMGYERFEKNKQVPTFTINSKGSYVWP